MTEPLSKSLAIFEGGLKAKSGLLELGRRATVKLTKCSGEVTVTREPEVQGQRCQIIAIGKKIERAGQPQP